MKKRSVKIGYTGAIGRPENACMIRTLKIPAFPISEEEAARSDSIALVDSQPQFFTDFSLPKCDIVIDHHPHRDKISAKFVDIRPHYASTSSIMTEYLKAAGVRLTKNLASALFYGIRTDTRHFMVDMSQGDMDALKCKSGPCSGKKLLFSLLWGVLFAIIFTLFCGLIMIALAVISVSLEEHGFTNSDTFAEILTNIWFFGSVLLLTGGIILGLNEKLPGTRTAACSQQNSESAAWETNRP